MSLENRSATASLRGPIAFEQAVPADPAGLTANANGTIHDVLHRGRTEGVFKREVDPSICT